MKIQIQEGQDTKQDMLAVGLFEEEKEFYKESNQVLNDEIKKAILKEKLKPEFGSTYATKITNSAYSVVLVVSLGKKDALNLDRVRRIASKIVRYMQASNIEGATTNIIEMLQVSKKFRDEELGRAFTEGLILSEYVFDKYISKPKVKKIESFSISLKGDPKEFGKGVQTGRIIAESTNYSRQLVNEPAEYMNPEQIEKEAKSLANKNIKVSVIGKKELEKLGLNGLLSVGRGSKYDPRLIILEYKGASEKPTVVVGKGVAFDSGGLHLKPFGYMETMKCDMSGASAIMGTVKAASELGLKKNIVGVIPACENMIDGLAYKPGDIIKMFNGKTVEVMNTDAEGRLILADAIAYAEKTYKPDVLIDLATLTGAVVVALGYCTAGLISNNDALSSAIIKAGEESYDRVWSLPFFEEYHDMVDGDVSDLSNISKKQDRSAGTIVGGVFLSKFVDKAKWAHIDIAGTAFLTEQKEYNPKWATGSGVRLLTYYFMK